MVTSLSYSAQVLSSGGSDPDVLQIGGGNDVAGVATDALNVGMSSQVTAVYENGSGAGTNPQWYAIAASHLGGEQVYGTAQDVSNTYKLSTPKTPGAVATFTGMPADSSSSNVWDNATWEKM